MRYIGSKTSSLDRLGRVFRNLVSTDAIVCDPFAGTCTVARHLKAAGFGVVTGDRLHASAVLQHAYVGLDAAPEFSRLVKRVMSEPCGDNPASAVITYLNNLAGTSGYITRTYSSVGRERRLFFTAANARRIDSIGQTIRKWSAAGLISRDERAYLATALIEAADTVANTAGTYYAFLKRFSRKAKKPLQLKPLSIVRGSGHHQCRRVDALCLVQQASYDVLYLDPPYNDREYAHYYHLPETLATGAEPEVIGRSGMPRLTPSRSRFCGPRTAKSALAEIVAAARCRYILLHYAANGLVRHKEILAILRAKGPTSYCSWYVRRYSTKSLPSRKCLNRLYVCQPQ